MESQYLLDPSEFTNADLPPLTNTLAGWGHDAAHLLSLAELMDRYPIHTLISLVGNLQAAAASIDGQQRRPLHPTHDAGFLRIIMKSLTDLRVACGASELRVSLVTMDELVRRLDPQRLPDSDLLKSRIVELVRCIIHEVETQVFLRLPSYATDYFERPALFGDAVLDRLAAATFDVEEAGNCYATRRYTGTVFHCMRVIEAALRAIYDSLGLNLMLEKDRSWGNMLNEIQGEIVKRDKAIPQLSGWQAQKAFYVEARAHLSAVKDAWRNPVMHVESRYDMRGAERIIQATRSFAEYVASSLPKP